MRRTDEQRDRRTLPGRILGRLSATIFLFTASLYTPTSHAQGDEPVTIDIGDSGMTFPTVDGATVTSTGDSGGLGWMVLVLAVTVLVVFTVYAIAGGDESEETDSFADETAN
jgi:hypothetical protein